MKNQSRITSYGMSGVFQHAFLNFIWFNSWILGKKQEIDTTRLSWIEELLPLESILEDDVDLW
jgi:hypothetical protein